MDIVVLDGEEQNLQSLISSISKIHTNATIHTCMNANDALQCIEKHTSQLAFLNMEDVPEAVEISFKMQEICPSIHIVFVHGYNRYLYLPSVMPPQAFLLKPIRIDELKKEQVALCTAIHEKDNTYLIRVQTFGNFEVFYQEEPLHFPRAKSKELFAYLIDRKGASVTMAEIAVVLWEEKEYNRSVLNQIHSFISDLMKLFRGLGIEDVIIKKRNSIAVNVEVIDCDYYRFLQGDNDAIRSFTDEYMSNYSWAEFTVGALHQLSLKNT